MLLDTTVFIDFLRGREEAVVFFQNNSNLSTSILVVMEVIAGLPKKQDIKKFEEFLNSINIDIYPINKEISQRAYEIFIDYFHRNGIGISDALIAATTIFYNQKLFSHNQKHFKFLDGLKLKTKY